MKLKHFILFMLMLSNFNVINAQISIVEDLELIGAVDMKSTKLERIRNSDNERDEYLLSFINIDISYGQTTTVSGTNMSIDFEANEKELNEFYLALESVILTNKSITLKLNNHTLKVYKK